MASSGKLKVRFQRGRKLTIHNDDIRIECGYDVAWGDHNWYIDINTVSGRLREELCRSPIDLARFVLDAIGALPTNGYLVKYDGKSVWNTLLVHRTAPYTVI
jgi:hypothetical protein